MRSLVDFDCRLGSFFDFYLYLFLDLIGFIEGKGYEKLLATVLPIYNQFDCDEIINSKSLLYLTFSNDDSN